EQSLSCSTCTMNGGTLTSWTNSATNTYTGVYTVVEGQTDRAAGASNFISIVLADAAGNTNAAYTTLVESGGAITIDANSPAISSATVTGGTKKIGDVITITVAAVTAGYTLGTSTMNGVNVAGFNDATGGSYTMTYTVVSGNTDRAAGATPISIILTDSFGNTNSAFTTLTESSALVIDANAPAATTSATIPGGTAKVGTVITVTIVASEQSLTCTGCTMNTVALASFTNSATNTYTATYTVVEGNTDRAAGATPVSITLTDAAGNSNAAYTTLTESSAQTVDANSPAATTSATGGTDALGVGDTITLTIVASEQSLSCSTCT
ncbi:uncharacterized protein METZ01_LOCUS347008, partial [marine metagenome]